MKATVIAVVWIAAWSSLPSAQERPVPKDSTRLSVSGCANGRAFTVGRDPTNESHAFELAEGMKLRLEGQKKVMGEIKAHEGSMIEITGLMKQSEVVQPGVGLAGGRVRITPVMPSSRTSSPSTGTPIPVFDVESYRLLNSSCAKR